MANFTQTVTAQLDGLISTVTTEDTFANWMTFLALTPQTTAYDTVKFCPGSTMTVYKSTGTTTPSAKDAVASLANQAGVVTSKPVSHALQVTSAGANLTSGVYFITIFSDCTGR